MFRVSVLNLSKILGNWFTGKKVGFSHIFYRYNFTGKSDRKIQAKDCDIDQNSLKHLNQKLWIEANFQILPCIFLDNLWSNLKNWKNMCNQNLNILAFDVPRTNFWIFDFPLCFQIFWNVLNLYLVEIWMLKFLRFMLILKPFEPQCGHQKCF
jgi:hypothetical protein